mgnify:CR=1 FL=1
MELALQQEKAKQLRADIVKMTYLAKSGHPGGSLSCVEMLMALYYNIMKVDPSNPGWEERDRFVLSKGHACPALYAVLADKGYFPREDLWTLRKFHSHLQGHPDMRKTPGVDANTGSLGQGVSIAVGMALGSRLQGKGAKVYTLLGDGELQEGQVWEAAMAAAHYKLDNLTFMLDYNKLQIDGRNDEVMSLGNIMKKFDAFGFECFEVDGHDMDAIVSALKAPVSGRPKFICCNTVKGKGVSFMEDQFGWHGSPMNKEQFEKALSEQEVE